jgi:hypothetical protein
MRILSTISFFFKAARLNHLQKVIHGHQKIDASADIYVLTNTQDALEINLIRTLSSLPINIISITELPNPWYLTWAHKQIIRERINEGYDYFIYTEDDIELRPENFEYWVRNRKILKPHGFYPSFIRVEFSNFLQKWVSTDIQSPSSVSSSPRLRLEDPEAYFLNFSKPYQGMFLYDLELMKEHLATDESNLMSAVGLRADLPTDGGGVAEYANFALTFTNVPSGFYSRNLVRFHEKFRVLDPASFIHHLPNNYANRADTGFGKIPLDGLLVV